MKKYAKGVDTGGVAPGGYAVGPRIGGGAAEPDR